jgi:hypothetical protein
MKNLLCATWSYFDQSPRIPTVSVSFRGIAARFGLSKYDLQLDADKSGAAAFVTNQQLQAFSIEAGAQLPVKSLGVVLNDHTHFDHHARLGSCETSRVTRTHCASRSQKAVRGWPAALSSHDLIIATRSWCEYRRISTRLECRRSCILASVESQNSFAFSFLNRGFVRTEFRKVPETKTGTIRPLTKM